MLRKNTCYQNFNLSKNFTQYKNLLSLHTVKKLFIKMLGNSVFWVSNNEDFSSLSFANYYTIM
jgi:hypothetical protein